jgi:hypothetical protein
MCAIGAPSFDREFNIVALKALAKGLPQRVLQQSRFTDAVKAKDPGAAGAFEVAVLVVGRLLLPFWSLRRRSAVLGSGTVPKHAVVAGDFVREAGVGEAIKRSVQRYAVHVGQRVLNVLVRKSTLGAKQGSQHFHPRPGNAHGCVLQLRFGACQQRP